MSNCPDCLRDPDLYDQMYDLIAMMSENTDAERFAQQWANMAEEIMVQAYSTYGEKDPGTPDGYDA